MDNNITISGGLVVLCDLDEGVKPLSEMHRISFRRESNPMPIRLNPEFFEQDISEAADYQRMYGGQR